MFNLKKNNSVASADDTAAEVPSSGRKNSGGPKKPLLTLKPSRQTCIVLGSLMGGTLVASGGLYAWQTGQIAQTEKQVADRQAEVSDGEKISKRLQSVETAYGTTQNQLRYLETSVTASEYVPTLLKQMETLAKSVNLKVAAVRPTLEPAPKPPADKEARKTFKAWPYDKIHVDMDVSGSYWDVAKMLYSLTEFPKIMSVEAVQVTPEPRTDAKTAPMGAPNLNVKLKLTGFIFPTDGLPRTLPPGLPSTTPSALPSGGSGATGTSSAPPSAPPAASTTSAAIVARPRL